VLSFVTDDGVVAELVLEVSGVGVFSANLLGFVLKQVWFLYC